MAWILIIIGLVLIAVVVYLVMFAAEGDSNEPIGRTRDLSGKYSTNMTRFAARKETKAAQARGELAKELNVESDIVTRLAERQADAEHQRERLEYNFQIETANYQVLLDQNKLTRQLIGEAATHNMDVATYLELKKKTEMDRLDLGKQWKQAEQELKAGFIFQLQAHQHLALMTEYIGTLYERAKRLQDEGKDREHVLIEEHIVFMEGDFRERQRLLQTSQQEDIQGGDETTDTPGDDSETV